MAKKDLVLSGYMPGEEQQGVTALYDEIVAAEANRQPPKDYVIVARIRAHKLNKTVDGDALPSVTVRVVAAEVLRDGDEVEALALLRGEHDRRYGPAMISGNGELNDDAVVDPPTPVDDVPLPEPDEQVQNAAEPEPAEPAATEPEPTPIRKGRGRGRAT